MRGGAAADRQPRVVRQGPRRSAGPRRGRAAHTERRGASCGRTAQRIASTTTNDRGEYYFNDTKLDGKLQPSKAYEVRIDTTQPALSRMAAHDPERRQRARHDRFRRRRLRRTGSIARLTTGGAGQNDHTYDFGFYRVTTDAARGRQDRVPVDRDRRPTLLLSDHDHEHHVISHRWRRRSRSRYRSSSSRSMSETTRGRCTLNGHGRTAVCSGDLDPSETVVVQIYVRAVERWNRTQRRRGPAQPSARSAPADTAPVRAPARGGSGCRAASAARSGQGRASERVVTRGRHVVFRLTLRNPSRATARRVRALRSASRRHAIDELLSRPAASRTADLLADRHAARGQGPPSVVRRTRQRRD